MKSLSEALQAAVGFQPVVDLTVAAREAAQFSRTREKEKNSLTLVALPQVTAAAPANPPAAPARPPTASNAEPVLSWVDGESTTRFDLKEGANTIGRSPDNTLAFANSSLSRYHARIMRSGRQCDLEDLNSSNGCYVNGQRLTQLVRLQPGDRIMIGSLVFDFRLEHPQPAPSAATAGLST
jgi:hypothetical protein